MTAVDWSQFRDGDRVRVVFEGTVDHGEANGLHPNNRYLNVRYLNVGTEDDTWRLGPFGGCNSTLEYATSAELIERPFTPPAAGKLFRKHSILCISLGDLGYRTVRDDTGPVSLEFRWRGADPHWLASIEVLDL